MSTATNAAPPKGPKNRQPADDEPDPNANRAANYPTEWKIQHNKQTAKCNICSRTLAGTRWCVECAKCRTRICSPCWKGERYNKYDEAIFEGGVQNSEGCWTCRFGRGSSDPAWRPKIEERNVRMRQMIADGYLERKNSSAEPPMNKQKPQDDKKQTREDDGKGDLAVAKKRKIQQDDDEETFAASYERQQLVDDPAAAGIFALQEPTDKVITRHRPARLDALTLQASLASVRQGKQVKHLHEKTTIIIGAGVVGLSIARELARTLAKGRTDHEIIVIDHEKSYAQSTSSECAGLVTKHGVPQDYASLLELSLHRWNKILNKTDSIHRISEGVIHVKAKTEGRQESNAEPPSWYNHRSEDIYRKHASDVGKISTPHYLKWLYTECQDLGVQFRFGQEVPRITKTKGHINEVDICRADDHKREVTIPCHNIIIAAGSQTPEALNILIPWSNALENFNQQHFDWVRYGSVNLKRDHTDQDAIMTRGLDGTYSSIIVPQSDSQEILVGSVHDAHFAPPNVNRAEILASNRLSGATRDKIAKQGSTTVSTSYNNRPLVDKVPSVLIDQRFQKAESSPLGIYVAYGFGKFGTTLAPGVATVVCRMVMGEESGIGDSFRYPTPDIDFLPGF